MPTSCEISKSLKAALSRCTAKEPQSLDADAEELRLLRACHEVRFFSAGAGDADVLASQDTAAAVAIAETPRAIPSQPRPRTIPSPPIGNRTSESNNSKAVDGTLNRRQPKPGRSSPQRSLPPWKKLWKGPLPPPRHSPKLSIGDVLLPALRNFGSKGNVTCAFPRTNQNPTEAKRSGVGLESPKRSGAGQAPKVSFSKRNRRRAEPIVVHHPVCLAPPKPSIAPRSYIEAAKPYTAPRSYVEAVMAGGRRREPGGQRGRRGRGAHPGATHSAKLQPDEMLIQSPRATLPCPTAGVDAISGGGGGRPRRCWPCRWPSSKGSTGRAPVWPPNRRRWAKW
ncbi:hypothetical protein U9M48_040911 [Paspalum notatum var. saurae]|uniref:Uncharacterized protein n=1 Tax=Paspalum notatum var. saurae TaxID=547442 RepID=A0AAQ3UTC2_PASNO